MVSRGVPVCAHTGYLVFFTGVRTNECYQRCEVFVGEVLVTRAGEYDIVDREGHIQGRVVIEGEIKVPQQDQKEDTTDHKEVTPPNGQSTPKYRNDSVESDVKPIHPDTSCEEHSSPKRHDDNHNQYPDIYINPQMTTAMIRDTVRGVLGTPVGVDLWYHQVCYQQLDRRDNSDDFAHAEHMARWYLRWRDIPLATFLDEPTAYPDVLQFVVAHAAWSYPYGADTCVRGACESFNTPRWIDSRARSGDCEDLAVAVAALFYTLQSTPRVRTALSQALCRLARRYRCRLVDAVIRVVDRKEAQLHAYVRLVSTDANATRREILIDSTHRLWHCGVATDASGIRALLPVLRRLYEAMRVCPCACDRHSCEVCRAANLADMFTWATPAELLQNLTHTMYQYELRYFEPRTRRVYAPERRDADAGAGTLGAHFDKELHNLPVVDITHRFRRSVDLQRKRCCPALFPPVPGLVFHKGRGAIGDGDPSLKACVPVFLREADALRVFRTSAAAISWFETHCAKQKLHVVAAERLYVHAPELYNWVFFVQ